MRRRALLSRVLLLGAAASLAFAGVSTRAAETSAPRNPFLPANNAGTPAATAHETIEFAGVSKVGKTTHLIFHDKTLKKNRWIGLGETVEGISVLKYDPEREQVVVKINGAEKTLVLRKGSGPANSPAPVVQLPPAAGFAVPPQSAPTLTQQPHILPAPAPTLGDPTQGGPQSTPQTPPPAPGTAAATQAKQETEARMLVSDLLEIGMAQRKAYEEAQRRAAAGEPPPQTTTPPATGQPAAK